MLFGAVRMPFLFFGDVNTTLLQSAMFEFQERVENTL